MRDKKTPKQGVLGAICFICGLLLGAAMMFTAYRLLYVSKLPQRQIMGGWFIDLEQDAAEKEGAPRSLCFYEKTVEITTADGTTVSCDYTISKSDSGIGTVIRIYDFKGEDIEMHYSCQPLLHITWENEDGSIWKADYLFAG